MNEIIEVRIKLKKKDLVPFMEKLGVDEWSFKKDHVDLDMTNLFDKAMTEIQNQDLI